jgi:pilus assembly protein CpaF
MNGINLGILEDLGRRTDVSDIAVMCDGGVWVDQGEGMRELDGLRFRSPEDVRMYAVQLCSQLGRRLDDSMPIADASTPEGIRVHAVLAPIVPSGASLSIRLPGQSVSTLETLVASGFISESFARMMGELVRKKATCVITGGTGTGKTTLLRAMIAECEKNERIVCVEETREINPHSHHNIVSLATRDANVEGAGAIGLPDLVKATVRMRPDRIVLGECRGEEVGDLLRAFNSGHRGGFVTIHSDSVERLPSRLVALGLLAGLPRETTFALAQNAFDVIIHCERVDGRRFVSQVGVLHGVGGGRFGEMVGEMVGMTIMKVTPVGEHGRLEIERQDGWDAFARQWGLSAVGGE